MVTQARLKETIHYDPSTGFFTWLKRPGDTRGDKIFNGQYAGKTAGGLNKSKGYWAIKVDGKDYYAHRLVWLYSYGKLPASEIDHINHNRQDNSIDNLRTVNRLENQRNMSKRKVSTSGVTGIAWDKSRGKWQGQIEVNNKNIFLGRFDSLLDATCARMRANKQCNFHKNHGA